MRCPASSPLWLALSDGTQHLFGWETTPFRVYVGLSGILNMSWKKSTATVTKTSAFTFVAGQLYYVDVRLTDTVVVFTIYDWLNRFRDDRDLHRDGLHRTRLDHRGDEFTFLYNNSLGGFAYFAGQLRSVRSLEHDSDHGGLRTGASGPSTRPRSRTPRSSTTSTSRRRPERISGTGRSIPPMGRWRRSRQLGLGPSIQRLRVSRLRSLGRPGRSSPMAGP